jgi:hypothetical protein
MLQTVAFNGRSSIGLGLLLIPVGAAKISNTASSCCRTESQPQPSSTEQQEQRHRRTSITSDSDLEDDNYSQASGRHTDQEQSAAPTDRAGSALRNSSTTERKGETSTRVPTRPATSRIGETSIVGNGDATNRVLQPVVASPNRATNDAAPGGGKAAETKQGAGPALFGIDGAEARLAKWSLDGNSW